MRVVPGIIVIPAIGVAAYLTVLLAMLFMVGMKIAIQDEIDYGRDLITGLSFWIGIGFQSDLIFPAQVSKFAGGLLRNGVTSVGAAILMTAFVDMTKPR